MERQKRETICVENIGKKNNSGPLIPKEKSTRQLKGIIGSNVSDTALTEKEVEEFSKVNENAEWESETVVPQYYKVKIVGPLSFNNVCKLVMSINRCVVKYEGDIVTAETIWVGRLNALGKFVRANKGEITSMEVWERNPFKDNVPKKIECIDSVSTFVLYYNLGVNKAAKISNKCTEDNKRHYDFDKIYPPRVEGKVVQMCKCCFKRVEECECKKTKSYRTIEIDENMVDIISRLNRKGYETGYCCEGHPTGTYILMGSIPSLPKYAQYQHGSIYYNQYDVVVRQSKGKYTYEEEKECALKYIREWAEQLPPRSEVSDADMLPIHTRKYEKVAKYLTKEEKEGFFGH